MRTYTHGVIGYLLYAKRSRQEKRLAVLGGILPDVFLLVGFMPHYLETVTPSPLLAELHHLLHHSTLHTATLCMHSFVMVGPLLALSYRFYKPAVPCFVGMLAHGIGDLLTHRRWVYNHVYPLPLEPVRGIVSYTDMWPTLVEHAVLLCLVAGLMIKRKRRSGALGNARASYTNGG